MKANKREKPHRRARILALAAFLTLVAVAAGVYATFASLKAVWHEPCLVTDVGAQVSVTEGDMVKGASVLAALGLRNGVNLADVDFEARRKDVLEKIPNIRAISIARHLPDRVEITVEERTPLIRMGVSGQKASTGRVADADGVVFTCRRGTGMLPILRESAQAVSMPGQRLAGRTLAGLRLIEMAAEPAYASLAVLEADVTRKDFILMTLGNYAQAKVAWDGMDCPTKSTAASLALRLAHLVKAIDSNVGSDAKMWNAMEADRIYADTRETLL